MNDHFHPSTLTRAVAQRMTSRLPYLREGKETDSVYHTTVFRKKEPEEDKKLPGDSDEDSDSFCPANCRSMTDKPCEIHCSNSFNCHCTV
eukprot:jgi/Chrzof1/9046/Cz03g34040.t1